MSDKKEDFKLIRIADFRKKYFEGTAPSAKTIRNMIMLGELKAKKLAGVYYIILDHNFFNDTEETLDEFYEENVNNKMVPIPEKVEMTGTKVDQIFSKYAHLA